MSSSGVLPRPVAGAPGRGATALIGLALVCGLVFVAAFAVPYFSYNEARFDRYWPVRGWLLLHVTAGMVALLTGPVQLWLGRGDRQDDDHARAAGTVSVPWICWYEYCIWREGEGTRRRGIAETREGVP